jgi:hypothetical protein
LCDLEPLRGGALEEAVERDLHLLVTRPLGGHRHHLSTDQLEAFVLVDDAGADHFFDFEYGPPPPRQALGGLRREGKGGWAQPLVHAQR